MKIIVNNLQHKVSIPFSKIKSVAQLACRKLKFTKFELSVIFVGEKRMRRINQEYLWHDDVTDVVTFKHGEVIVCPAVAARNAKRYGNSVQHELLLYVVHGILHLCGYDDHTPADIKRMRQKEQELMGLLP